MTAPQLIDSLSDIADDYDALLCDVWGVIHNGRESFPAACEALVRFGRERGPVILISNAPRPSAAILPQLDGLGVPREAYAAVVTSGDATRAEVRVRAPGPVWAIGPARDYPLYDGLELEFVSGPETAAFICCTGLEDDETETAEDYRDSLAAAGRRNLMFLCANPDRVVQRGDRLIPCAGALADLYEGMGGEVVMAGKPFAPIYGLALEAAGERLGRSPDRSRVLAIGDGVQTDVLGADKQGLDLLFVADGIHAAEICDEEGQPDMEKVAAFLARHGTRARWISGALRWNDPLAIG